MTRQQKLDAFAKRKGYPSYFAYRNAQAKAEGYSSYSEMRREHRGTRTRKAATEKVMIPAHAGNPSRIVTRTLRENTGVVGGYSPALDMTREIRMAYREAARNTTDVALQAARIGEVRKRTQSAKEALVRPVVGVIDDLDGQVRDFYTKDFPKIYAAGARTANPNWRMGPGDQARINELTKEGAGRLVGNNRSAKRSAIKNIPELVDMDTKRGFLRAKNHPIKGTKFANGREPGFSQYAEMVLRSNGARAYNMGFLETARKGDKDRMFQVIDGPNCGWTSHDDSEVANGKIVTADQALSYPVAHPNCVRTFTFAPPGSKPTKGRFRKVAEKAGEIVIESAKATAKQQAISLAMHVATDAKVREAARTVLQTSKASFIQYRQNLDMVARLYEHSRKTRIAAMGNVTDIASRVGPKISAKDVADDVAAWMEDFADGFDVPEHVLRIIGAPVRAGRKAVGDHLDDFNVFYNAAYRMERGFGRIPLQTRTIGQPTQQGAAALKRRGPPTFDPVGIIKKAASDQFFEWLGPKIPQAKFMRFTFPNINRSINPLERPRRLTLDLGNLAKVTATSIKDRGLINHLSLNPNGLLRLSLSRDPVTKFITPTFRIIPPGPLHIMTKVNRGIKGNITSLSSEVRLITKPIPGVESFAARMNLNLRKLGLESLSDIKKLKKEDFLKLDAEDLRGVSIAANLRARGFNLFDISRTFRLPWEEAEKLWHLSNHYLDDILADLKAEIERAKFIVVPGGRTRNPLLPPSGGARPILRIVDPEKGDPFGPGGAVADIPRIKVPATLKSPSARRAYIEARLPNYERDRISQLRLAGDFSTIKHLRDTDKLTWEEIAVRMRMSITKVRGIHKRGVTGKVGKAPQGKATVPQKKDPFGTSPVRKEPPAPKPPSVEIVHVPGLGTVEPTLRPMIGPRHIMKDQEALQVMKSTRRGPNPIPDIEDPEIRSSLEFYQSDGYTPINTFLREGMDAVRDEGGELTLLVFGEERVFLGDVVGHIENIEKAMDPLEEYVQVYREVNLSSYVQNSTQDFKPGQRFAEDGFMSTSVTSELVQHRTARGYANLRIIVPRGVRGVWMGDWEKELLLERGLTLEVMGVDDKNNVVMKVVRAIG